MTFPLNQTTFSRACYSVAHYISLIRTSARPVHPEDQKNHSICPVYRDSFLGLFDEDHPLYPRDGSPAAKILAARGPVVGGPGAAAKAAMFRVNSGLPTNGSRTNNSANAPPPERDRTVSVMKRAQSLSSLATLVTSSQSSASTFTMKLSPMRGRPAGEEEGADEGEGEADDSHHLHAQELHATHTEGRSTPTKATHGSQATHSPHKVRSATPQACIDVTDEPWFQNERNGSLDQSAFEFVQKQLFQGTDMAESRTRSMVSTDGGTLRLVFLMWQNAHVCNVLVVQNTAPQRVANLAAQGETVKF